MQKRLAGLAWWFGAALWAYFWEFVRSLFYEQGSHMLTPFIHSVSIDQILHWGPPLAFAGIGAFLFWKTRPSGAPQDATLSISGPHRFKESQYKNKNRWRMMVHNAGPAAARNVQMKLRSGAPEPKDSNWTGDYPYVVYPVGTITNDPGHISSVARQINANDDERYEITCSWKAESGQFFTDINTKGGGHNNIQINSDERWKLSYEVTAENASPIRVVLEIFIEDDGVKVVRT
jgi:hypothetical protein